MKNINNYKSIAIALLSFLLIACGSSSDGEPQVPQEPDTDGDTIVDSRDNCIDVPNTDQLNQDDDSAGDACDDLPLDPSDTRDFDGDLIGDSTDPDDDNDGVNDTEDAFPYDATEQLDADGDLIGDNKDLDPTNANPNSILLDQLLANGRATKFIGAVSHDDERRAYLGYRVKEMGDINGDGLKDLFVSNHRSQINGTTTGLGYVLFGQVSGWPNTLDLADLSEIPHVVIRGDIDNSNVRTMGASIAALGDIDGDGLDDFMISDSFITNPGAAEVYNGAVYLVFGRTTWLADAGEDKTLTSTDLNGISVRFTGKQHYGVLGSYLEPVGDLNSDGKIDVAISESTGAQFFYPFDMSRVHILFNLSTYSKANIGEAYVIEDISNSADTLNRVLIEGLGGDRREISNIQKMEDFNNDGFNDFAISKPAVDHNHGTSNDGSLFVLFGKASNDWTDSIELTSLSTGDGFELQNASSQFDSTFAKDFKVSDLNADTVPDLIISHTSDNSSNENTVSEIHVLWGGNSNWPVTVLTDDIPSEMGLSMTGEEQKVVFGAQVEVVPDLDNNGYPEILIATDDSGQLGDDLNPANKVYKFDASLLSQGLVIGPTMLDRGDAELLTMSHAEEDDPFFVNVVPDMNGDGLAEFTLSATRKDSNGLEDNGEFYLVYGYDQLYPQSQPDN